ncbi:restriction endonuclease subunit S [Neisseria mucosa]|uniref:restriction endonuclease subunit S n=1 Tax=Neisseria mucosa TaxID=488 RepID=UPI0019213A60|nr:restriction endonuclease subunit S [Neisseria mucosa]
MTTEQQLPEGWEANFLKLLCTIKTGDKDVNQGSENGKYPFFTCAQEISFSETFSFEGEAILIAGNGNFNVKFYHGRFEAYQRTYVLQNFKNVDAKYLFYFINNKLGDITKGNRGSTIKYIRLGDIANYPIIYPTSKETQQAIVNKIESLFDEIDEGIGRLKTAVQQIQQYRQSLLKNAFNGELTKEWRSKHADTLPSENELLAQIQTTREQHHAQQLADWQTAVSQWEQNGKEGKKPSKPKAPTQAVKFEENFADLPRGWGVIRFENICDLIRNGISVKPEGESGIKILRISAVRPFQLNLDDYRFLNTDDVGDFVLNNGDLLFTRYNGTRNFVGVCAEFKSDEKYVYPDKLIRAVANSTKINSTFLMYGFNTGISRKFIESRIRTTAGQSGISGTDIKAIPVVICSPAEQTQIVAILESKLTACDQLAAELSNQLKQAELLKQAVLKAAFSGNLLDK